jgi:hypothetical protein
MELAGHMRDGRFDRAARGGVAAAPTARQRADAQRFLAASPQLRRRLVAAAAAARRSEAEGADVSAVRDALARAVAAAAERDAPLTGRHVDRAEAALAEADSFAPAAAGAADRQSVAGLVEAVGPAYLLGRELMTETHTPPSKLLARASGASREGQFREASSLIRLAASLLAVDLPSRSENAKTGDAPLISAGVGGRAAHVLDGNTGSVPGSTPEWFDSLRVADAPIPAARADRAVKLAEAMGASAAPGSPVRRLLRRARRELAAGDGRAAAWWAAVALNALGMTDAQIAAAAGAEDEATE